MDIGELLTEEQKARLTDELVAKTRAETYKLQQEARAASLAADKAQLDYEKAQREADENAAVDERNHVYNFLGPVQTASAQSAIKTLSKWHRLDGDDPKPIEIVFDSPGGSVIDGMHLFDYLRYLSNMGHHITTVALGYSASMAGILLQAGDTRVMGKESYLLIHEVSSIAGGKIGEIKDEVQFVDTISKHVIDIFVQRSGGKCTKAQFVRGWTRKDWWLDADAAFKLGFIDEIR